MPTIRDLATLGMACCGALFACLAIYWRLTRRSLAINKFPASFYNMLLLKNAALVRLTASTLVGRKVSAERG